MHLQIGNRTHIELDGVKVSTLSYAPAKILVEITANGGEISVEILDGDKVIATGSGASVELSIENARLWSAETPNLYRCQVTLKENGQVVDEVTDYFDIRMVDWSNMYLMDEALDMWNIHKNQYDYATDFNDWYLEDIKAMVEKDFNHPSVIMYSIGNEVSEPYQERGVKLTKEMVDTIHRLNRNRVVTGGNNLTLIYLASKRMGLYKEESSRASESKPAKKKEGKKQQASGILFSTS
jgi:beta-galactosidase/beta-glucuronidase